MVGNWDEAFNDMMLEQEMAEHREQLVQVNCQCECGEHVNKLIELSTYMVPLIASMATDIEDLKGKKS